MPLGFEVGNAGACQNPLAARHQLDQLVVQIEVSRREILHRLPQHTDFRFDFGQPVSRGGPPVFEPTESALDLGQPDIEIGSCRFTAERRVLCVVQIRCSMGFQSTRSSAGTQ